MYKNRHAVIRIYAMLAIITLPTIGMAGIIAQLQPAAGAVAQSPAAASSYGYICRMSVNPQYHNSEDIKISVYAFYSEGGRYVPKPIHISITIEYAGVGGVVRTINATINDNRQHEINAGRLDMATYTIKALFVEAQQIKTDNFIVLHDPAPYFLYLNRGGEIRFRAAEGDNFTVRIIMQYSPDRIEEKTYSNTTHFTYRPPAGVKVMSIYVLDRWGNINGMNEGQPYIWVYAQDRYYNLYRIVAAVIVSIVVLIAIVRIWGRINEK